MQYSFIDFGLKDFLRYSNGDVIIIDADYQEEAEDWLAENGEEYDWTNTCVRYWCWNEEES